ncbi:MAG: hypothetical protein K1X33_09460 [Methanobacteriaceae archaeon]|nr:hypothetical protein [Methanobacteriaceae archaeon]
MKHGYFLSVVGDVEAASEFIALCADSIDYANSLSREFVEPFIIKGENESESDFEKRRKSEIKYFKQKARYFAEDAFNQR